MATVNEKTRTDLEVGESNYPGCSDDGEKVTDGVVEKAEGYPDEPTDEEYATLRKVAAPLQLPAIAMCVVEIAERASYYGSKKAISNYVRGPLPKGGNGAGAVAPGAAGKNQTAGALGMGSVAASAVTSTFQFASYLFPIFGAVMADTKWGRWKTIMIGVIVGGIAHVILVIPAVPSVIQSGKAFGPFMVSVLILAVGAGLIKPCLAPLLCDQVPVKRPVVSTLKSGERVIIDPQSTVQRYLLIFYWCINIGAFWQIATSYTSRLVGFWLAYLLPVVLYLGVPLVLFFAKKHLYIAPAQGSVVLESLHVLRDYYKTNGLIKGLKGGSAAWNKVKPSYKREQGIEVNERKIFWDDLFVDEIRQTISACALSFILPIFYLADGGIGNMENDMSAAMVLNGIPNDITGNFNPLTIIICTPILTYFIYPQFERWGRPITPMTRIGLGFLLGSANMIIGAVVQHRIYSTSPCGYFATDCVRGVSKVGLAWLIPLSILPALGEVFISVTSYELAYTRAPARMKSLVYAIVLFNQAISAAISLALSNVIKDPYLIWPYVALACANFVCAVVVPYIFRHLDAPMKEFANIERQAGQLQESGAAVSVDPMTTEPTRTASRR